MIMTFSPDGSQLAVGVSHIATELIRADGTGVARTFHSADDNSLSVVFSPDGSRLATADSDGSARIWTVSTGAGVDLGTPSGAASAVIFGSSFDPTGDTFVTYAGDGTAQLWDAATASAIGPRVSGDASPVMAAGWLDDETLATFQADGTVRRITVGFHALQNRACSVAGRTLTPNEWHQYLPGEAFSPACKPR